MKYLLILFCLIPLLAKSQSDSGFVQFYVYPDNCEILINNSIKVGSKQLIKLKSGENILQIKGNDKLKIINEKIIIYKDSTSQYRKILTYNDEYLKYQSDLKKYNFKNAAYLATASILTIGSIGFIYIYTKNNIINRNEYKNSAELNAMNYNNAYSLDDMEVFKKAYEKDKENYYKYNRNIYYAIPIALASSYACYKLLKASYNLKRPEFKKHLSFNYGGYYNDKNYFQLTYKF